MALPLLAPIYRSVDLRAIDDQARALPLMERAGLPRRRRHGRWPAIVAATSSCSPDPATTAATRSSSHAGCAGFYDTAVVFRGDPAKLPGDAAAAHRAFVAAGGTTLADIPAQWRGTLVVDGLFGIGLKRALSADYAALVEGVNATAAPILALDVPSGLDADTGVALEPTIRAAAPRLSSH